VSKCSTWPFPQVLTKVKWPDPERNLFSSPDWLSVLVKTYNLKLFVKFIEREGKVSSYIVYSVVHNFLEDKICMCSYCDYCDGPIERKEDWDVFFEALCREYPRYRIAVRNLRDSLARENAHFKVLSKERYHLLDIRDDLKVLWKKAHDSFRSAVTQAQKTNLTIKVGDKADLKRFYDLHLRLRKNKYRLFAQPYKFFDNIWETYLSSGKGFLLGAFEPGGTMLAATVYLICGDTLYYKFNTSNPSTLKLRPNNLVFWEGVKMAKERGLKSIDLGSSGQEQEGLIRFKEHTGARGDDITHLGFNPPDYKFSQKVILKNFTRFCTAPWVPDFVTRLGSHIIYPYLA